MTNFHPDLELITEYAAGSLPLAQGACVSIHVNQCRRCQRIAGQLTDLGASLFEALQPVPVGDAQLDAVLARLDDETVTAGRLADAFCETRLAGAWRSSYGMLDSRFDAAHLTPERTIVSCGSGVTACHTLLAMAHAGLDGAALYVGSWSEWCRSDRPREPR